MYCSNCGQQQPDDSKFCNNCGKVLQAQQPPIQNQPAVTATPVSPPPINQIPVQPAPKRRKPWYKRWWIWVIIGFFGTAVLSGILNNVMPKQSSSNTSATSSNPKSSVTVKPTEAPPTEDPEEVKADYIDSCATIDYKTLERNPDNYKGEHLKFTGKVIQVLESDSWFDDSTTLRINVTENKYEYIDESTWTDTIICTVTIAEGADRILEDDIVDIYGDCYGLYTYESILKQKISVPRIDIKYYTIHDQ